MSRRKSGETSFDVDMSPLIDMVFILLIFFMVTSTFVKDMSLELKRPGAQSSTKASSKSLRIFIDSKQMVYVDDFPVRTWSLQGKLREMLRSQNTKSVLVVTDESVQASTLVQVVDQARLAGAEDVGVATEQEAGGG
ncbi:biopolymer transporter ExbD [bacterium]|nr:biopolymer transporter ExbD [bacterium]